MMVLLASNDWRTRHLIEKGMSEYFDDEKHAPHPNEKDYEIIQRRRVIARRFLFGKPHLRKETARVVGCGAAYLIALIGFFYAVNWLQLAAYFVLIGTLITNEAISMRWRFRMYQEIGGML
jgi:hypothetical protein